MKKIWAVMVLVSVCAGVAVADNKADREAIRTVITEAYVMGLHNGGDLEKTRKGFDPAFNLLIQGKDGTVKKLAIADWIQKAEQRELENPEGPEVKTRVKFLKIDVTGTAAVAKIELYREQKRIFTDYLSLYKFGDDWRIVGKIYYRH